MMARIAAVVLVALLGCLAGAEAQSSGSPSNVSALKINSNDPDHPQVAMGWQFFHASFCYTWSDGAATWLYVYATNGGYIATPHPAIQSVLAPVCQTGNLVAVNVFNAASGAWREVLTYSFK